MYQLCFKNINYFHKIVKLSLSGCGFIMNLMLPLIKEIKTLKYLDLSNNNIGISRCNVTVEELVDLKKIKLQKLNISNIFKMDIIKNFFYPNKNDILDPLYLAIKLYITLEINLLFL
jgi:protein associated with RNAse G/E